MEVPACLPRATTMAGAVDVKKLTVGVIPGTGLMGGLLAGHLAQAGITIIVGSRDEDKAKRKAAELPGNVKGASNEDAAAAADVIFWAVNVSTHLDTIGTHM